MVYIMDNNVSVKLGVKLNAPCPITDDKSLEPVQIAFGQSPGTGRQIQNRLRVKHVNPDLTAHSTQQQIILCQFVEPHGNCSNLVSQRVVGNSSPQRIGQ